MKLTFFILALGIFSNLKAQNDLTIQKLETPQWEETTMMKVSIKNKGPEIKDTVWLMVSDSDMTSEQASELGLLNKENEWIFEENDWLEAEGDSDYYFEHFFPITNLRKNETRNLNLNLGEYWPYDGNCELKLEIDCKQTIQEKNEENNVKYFFAGG